MKISYAIVTLMLLIGLFITSQAWSATVSGLYSADIPVTTQSAQVQNAAIPQALGQVLIKVSGNSNILNIPQIKNILANANNYLQQYGYRQPDDNTQGSLVFHASFDAKAINQLLTDDGQPIWGKNRPLTLLWLVVTNPQNGQMVRYIASSDTLTPMQQVINQSAKLRGIPVIFPIIDIQDLQNVTVDDILQNNISRISQVSTRYNPDVIVIASINTADNLHWQGQWLLSANGKQNTWQNTGSKSDDIVKAGINQIADLLANNFAVKIVDTQQQQLTLNVSNVKSLADYASVMKYLQQLPVIKSLDVAQVTPDSVIFTLQVVGGQAALQQVISGDHELKPTNLAAGDNNSNLSYQWAS